MFFNNHKICDQRLVSRRVWTQCLLATSAAMVLSPQTLLAEQAEKIRVHLLLDDVSSMQHLPVLLAQHLGYFKAEGLQVDVIEQSFAPSAA